jgi:hypothetical protein
VKYLQHFLSNPLSSVSSVPVPGGAGFSGEREESEQHTLLGTDKTDKSPSVGFRQSAEAPEPCSECGSTNWTTALVDDLGERTCHACLSGLTAMRRNGAAI